MPYRNWHKFPEDIEKVFDLKSTGKIPKSRGYIGIDTETYKGNLHLIAKENDYLLNRKGISTYEALKFILGTKEKDVWFFNIRYDYESITKSALLNSDSKGKKAFKTNRYVVTPDNKIIDFPYKWNKHQRANKRYVPVDHIGIYYNEGKGLKITYKTGKKRNLNTYAYDVANFFNLGGLDKSSKELLGEDKGKLSNDYLNIEDISKIPDNALIQRCQKDAELTKKLGEYLDAIIKQIAVKMGYHGNFKYLSNAKVAKTLLENLYDYKTIFPFYKDYDSLNEQIIFEGLRGNRTYEETERENYETTILNMLEYANNCYKGGLFILFEKGLHEGLDLIDISSAYPNVIRTLPSLKETSVRYTKEVNYNALFGFYHAKMQYDGYSPLRSNTNELFYPKTIRKWDNFITKEEVLFLRNRGYKLNIIDGYEIHDSSDNKPEYPFKNLINELSRLKQEHKDLWKEKKDRKDYAKYILIKGIMNSIYGIFAETKYGIGKIANFVYAATITARVRIYITSTIETYFDKVIEIDTDSIMGNLKPQYKHYFDNNHALGQFERDPKIPHRIINIATGLSFNADKGEFNKSRGFNIKLTKEGTSVKGKVSFSKDGKKIIIDTSRPLHSKEALIQGKIQEINEWQNTRKEITLNDNKRIWKKELTWETMQNESIESEPYGDMFLNGMKGFLEIKNKIPSNYTSIKDSTFTNDEKLAKMFNLSVKSYISDHAQVMIMTSKATK